MSDLTLAYFFMLHTVLITIYDTTNPVFRRAFLITCPFLQAINISTLLNIVSQH
jgi:hypothetical protein